MNVSNRNILKYCSTILIFCITTFIVSSCDSNRVYEQNLDIDNLEWSYEDTLHFESFIKEPGTYNLIVNIRHGVEYEWRNLWLQVLTLPAHDSTWIVEKHNIQLSQPNGKWYGKCSGNMCSIHSMYKQNLVLNDTGTYQFQIIQDMRENPLSHIMTAGIRIEKAIINE